MIADEYVDREFGSGAVKITPAHDPNDYDIGQRHGLPLINIMNNDASLNSNAGPYAGLDRFAARKQLWADMEVSGGAPAGVGSHGFAYTCVCVCGRAYDGLVQLKLHIGLGWGACQVAPVLHCGQ